MEQINAKNVEQKNSKTVVPCEVYSRVTGFYRPVSQFNAGKKEEFRERRYISLEMLKKNLNNTIANDM